MSTAEETKPEVVENNEPKSIVDSVFDAALAWVDVGLGHVKTSLDGGARAMEKSARALDAVREKLRA